MPCNGKVHFLIATYMYITLTAYLYLLTACARFGYVIIRVFTYLLNVIECPD